MKQLCGGDKDLQPASGASGSGSQNISVDQYNHLMTMLAHNNIGDQESCSGNASYSGNALLAGNYCLFSALRTNNWIIDSGASDHMCSSLSYFHTYKELHIDNQITIPDGTKLKVTHIGNIKLNNYIELIDVLYAPTFKFNLIFVHKLCQAQSYSVHFTSEFCTLQAPSRTQPIILGRMSQSLYFADGTLFHTSTNKSPLSTTPCLLSDNKTTFVSVASNVVS